VPTTLITTLAVILLVMFALWCVSLALRNASIVDPFWGFGFVIVAWLVFWLREGTAARSVLLLGCTSAWGLRLSVFLLWRNAGHGEDPRYAAMREHHGQAFWWRSLLTVFGLQGVLLWFIAFPQQFGIVANAPPLDSWDAIPLLVWLAGFIFETVGDWQLARFRANPANRGRVLDTGLWRYTRHPNYFGDFCVWWGFYLIAARNGAWGTLASPVLMSILLLYVSGVRLTESSISERRPEYEKYKRRTNAFFPGPPKAA
jgi:steroid 5-alpha reductase family enzyme